MVIKTRDEKRLEDMTPEEQVMHFAKLKAAATERLRKLQEVQDRSEKNAANSTLNYRREYKNDWVHREK